MRRRLLVLLVALALVSFVSPFSYLPNPAGVYYLVFGGYSYDPRLPFLVNGFALLRADVSAALKAKLDGLIGTTGLDPLDPVQPLRGYEVEQVTYGAGRDWASGSVRMTYADGSSRRYEIPVVQSSQSWGRPGGWAYTGLDRYFAPHQELPNLPLAGPDAPVRLGVPQRLSVPEETHRVVSVAPYAWYTSASWDGAQPVWSPNGDAFAVGAEPDYYQGQQQPQLWMVGLGNGKATRISMSARYPAWSSDGRSLVFLRLNPKGPTWQIVAVDRENLKERVLANSTVETSLSIAAGSVWYSTEASLWRVDPQSEAPARVIDLPGLATSADHFSLAVSADGQRVAYRSEDALSLVDADGSNLVRVDLGAQPPSPTPTISLQPGALGPVPTALPASKAPPVQQPASEQPGFASLAVAWSPRGDRLAVAASNHQYSGYSGTVGMPVLRILDRDGNVIRETVLGPNGLTATPQWTPDGRWIFLNTFPEGGRRIVAVEAASGRVLDLSQPGWDTFFSLAPSGRELLLWNGRGGFWKVPVNTH